MKIIKSLSILFIAVLITVSCNSENTVKTATYWVNSFKTECDAGAGKAQCLLVFNGEGLNNENWNLFYAVIEGFKFEPGYIQKIEVKETQLDPKDVQADASSIKYELVKVLEKMQDKKILLNDVWAATHINAEEINTDDANRTPTLEINLSKMQVFGSDGCNNYCGSIKSLDSNKIVFGPLASTRKMCLDMTFPDQFNQAITQTASYKQEQLALYLYNEAGQELLRLKKVD
ncbi:DUF4377 domain-containing protein [Flavisericum labens]|uniref:DUF4377 domain-containing protein n=1 Tax=Flavisericum labens TaxID=3377112 RepID=UPI00387B9CE1